MTTRTTAICYGRFSPRPDAATSDSIDSQFGICRMWADSQRPPVEIVEYFSDPDASGDDEDRPGVWQAISKLRKGMVLLVAHTDRLYRSVYLSEIIHRDARKRGASIVSVAGGRNGESPQDVFVRQVLAAFHEMEKKVIAARTRAKMLYHQANGRSMGRVPPYGMKRGEKIKVHVRGVLVERHSLVVDEEEMAVVRRVVRLDSEGLSLGEIRRALEASGARPRGKRWGRSLVQRILARYAGNVLPGDPPPAIEAEAATPQADEVATEVTAPAADADDWPVEW